MKSYEILAEDQGHDPNTSKPLSIFFVPLTCGKRSRVHFKMASHCMMFARRTHSPKGLAMVSVDVDTAWDCWIVFSRFLRSCLEGGCSCFTMQPGWHIMNIHEYTWIYRVDMMCNSDAMMAWNCFIAKACCFHAAFPSAKALGWRSSPMSLKHVVTICQQIHSTLRTKHSSFPFEIRPKDVFRAGPVWLEIICWDMGLAAKRTKPAA